MPLARVPFLQRSLHIEWSAPEIDVGIEALGMQRRHELPVLELQEHLCDRGDSGGGFEVTDVGFDRSDGAELSASRGALEASAFEGPHEAGDFDRISQ